MENMMENLTESFTLKSDELRQEILKKIEDLSNRNIKLWTEDGKLKFRAATGLMTLEDKEYLKTNKEAVIACLLDDHVEIESDDYNQFEPFPLTEIQQAYVLGRNPAFPYGGTACHIYLEFEYDSLDAERVEKIWNKLIKRHPMLRATMSADGYQQVMEKAPDFHVIHQIYNDINLAALGRDELKAKYDHKIYDTNEWPLFTVAVTNAPNNAVLHISIEFITADWTSIWTILSEFETLYFDTNAVLPDLNVRFRDYVVAERKMRRGSSFNKDREYWLKRLDALPSAPELPLLDNFSNDNVRFERNQFMIGKHEWDRFCDYSRATGITPAAAVMAVYAATLARWSRNKDFCINLSILNRLNLHPEIGSIVGDFTNSSLLEVNSDRMQDFASFALSLNRRLFDDLDHRSFTGVNVLRELQHRGNVTTLMPYVFTGAIGLIDIEKSDLHGKMNNRGISQTAQVFMDCQAMDSKDGLNINLDCRCGIFPKGLPEDIAQSMKEQILKLSNSQKEWNSKLFDIKLPDWQRRIIEKSNDTAYPEKKHLLHSQVLKNIIDRPERLVIAEENQEWNGKELYLASQKITSNLLKHGVKKGDRIAVLLPKSRWQTAACLGILSLGAIYVPIDTEQGRNRIGSIIDEAGALIAISDKDNKNELSDDVKTILIENIDSNTGENTDDIQEDLPDLLALSDEITIEDTAYIIFTSGSTGEPKGVEMTHGAAVNTIEAVNRLFGVTENDRVLQISQLNFDLSVYDIFGVIGAGGSIVIPNEKDYKNPAKWVELINRYNVTLWNSVPALLQLLLIYKQYNNDVEINMLKKVFLSGDWIPTSMPSEIKTIFPEALVVSMGGATEGGIWSNYHICLDKEDDSFKKSIPYGKPLPNQGFRILDVFDNESPIWSTGELCISGESLASSYYGRPDLTEKSFIVWNGQRLYRTGDMGCWHSNGEMEFLGRMDNQVKIRGHRIELGEIEEVIKKQLGFSECVAVVYGDDNEKNIAVFIIKNQQDNIEIEADPDVDKIKNSIGEWLPAYMIPSVYLFDSKMPLTANGKVDRKEIKKLAEKFIIENSEKHGEDKEVSEFEKNILEIIRNSFGFDCLGLDQNFYEAGANSLMLARAAGNLNKEIDCKATFDSWLVQLLNSPTAREAAIFAETEKNKFTDSCEDNSNEANCNNLIIEKVDDNGKICVVFESGIDTETMTELNNLEGIGIIKIGKDVSPDEIELSIRKIISDETQLSFLAGDSDMNMCIKLASDFMTQGIVPNSVNIVETDNDSEMESGLLYVGDINYGLVYSKLDESDEIRDILSDCCVGEINIYDCGNHNKKSDFLRCVL